MYRIEERNATSPSLLVGGGSNVCGVCHVKSVLAHIGADAIARQLVWLAVQ
jgi:hypothetical protein